MSTDPPPDERLEDIRRRYPDSSPEVQRYLARFETSDQGSSGAEVGEAWERWRPRMWWIAGLVTIAAATGFQVWWTVTLPCDSGDDWGFTVVPGVLAVGGFITVEFARSFNGWGWIAAWAVRAGAVILAVSAFFLEYVVVLGTSLRCAWL